MRVQVNSTAVPLRMPFFYGWVIVGLSTIGVFFSSPGQTYFISVFINPLINEFGWSRSLVSSLYSFGTLIAGLLMTYIGRLTERLGFRKMFTIVPVLLGMTALFMSVVGSPAMLFIAFLFLRIFGQGAMTLVPYSLVPQWFLTQRGKALSIVTLGSILGSAFFPYMNLLIISAFDWQMAWRFWAVLLFFIMAPLGYLFTRERPEDVGLLPDNAKISGVGVSKDDCINEQSYSLKNALKMKPFWVLLSAVIIHSMINTGLTFHHMSILLANGLSEITVAGVFTVAAVVSFPITLFAGYLCDRWPIRYIFSATMVIHGFALIFILWTTTPFLAVSLGVIRGVDRALSAVLTGVVWPQYYGREYIASIRGLTTAAMIGGSALGPIVFGVAYDVFGGYNQTILTLAILPFAAAISLPFARPPRKTTLTPEG